MEVGLLEHLSPAETYFFINGNHPEGLRILKLILLDLHLRKQLRLVTLGSLTKNRDFSSSSISVSLYDEEIRAPYKLESWYAPFFAPFRRDIELSYRVEQYLKALRKAVGDPMAFARGTVMRKSLVNNLYKTQGLMQLFGAPKKLTEEGKEEKKNLIALLTRLEHLLPSLLKNDMAKAKEIARKIGGNVLLLRIGASLQKELGKDFSGPSAQVGFADTKPYAIDADYLLCFDTFFLNAIDYHFTTAFAPPEPTSSWFGDGCGSDGGSGCGSGCGGCGGCGGD